MTFYHSNDDNIVSHASSQSNIAFDTFLFYEDYRDHYNTLFALSFLFIINHENNVTFISIHFIFYLIIYAILKR